MTPALAENMSELKITCEECGLQVRNKKVLKVHIKNEHSKESEEKEVFTCKICEKEVSDWKNALQHTEVKHYQTWTTMVGKQEKKRYFVCVKCDHREETEEQMMEHWVKNHSEGKGTKEEKKEETEDIKKEPKFECEECERSFTTKQGRNLHVTMKHRKAEEKAKKKTMKRERSVEQKGDKCKCKLCDYKCNSRFALKTHISQTHKEPISPQNKKQKTDDVVEKIIAEVVNTVIEEPKSLKTIEPSKKFLTNTAKTLAEMLDGVADNIDDVEIDADEDGPDFTEIFENPNNHEIYILISG